MQAFHLVNVLLWVAMLPIALLTGLKSSVPFLVLISILALVYSEMASWQGSLSERRLDHSDDFGGKE